MPMQWTLQNERLLFLRVLDSFKGPMDYKWLAETWPNPNERPTPRAISEHIWKLKKVAKAESNFDPAAATASAPSTPKSRPKTAPRSRAATASASGKAKRKRDAIEETTPERTFTPINSSRIKHEQDEYVAFADLHDETPSKRTRKPAQHLNMAPFEGSSSEDTDDQSADPEYDPDEAKFIDYEGNADKYEFPENY